MSKFLSLGSSQKRFLWTHEECLALHPVVGLVLQAGDVTSPHGLGFKGLDPFLRVRKQGLCFTAIGVDGDDRRLVDLELACKAESVALPDPV